MLTQDDIYVLNTWLDIAERWEHRAKGIRETVERAFELRTMKGIDEMPAYQFNSAGITPQYSGGGQQLPTGKHPVVIVGSDLKPAQSGQGGYIEFTLEAIDGPAKGVRHIDRLNVYNQNNQTVEIANKQLAAYCTVIGVPAFQATEELHGKPFVVDIAPQSKNPQYNEVKAIFDMQGNEPGKAGNGPMGGGQPQGGGFGGGQPQGGGQGGFGNQGGGQGGGFPQGGGGQPQGGGFGATGTGTIPPQDQQQQGGGQWGGQGGGQPQGGQPQGGGSNWQQGGGQPQGGAAGGAGGPQWGRQ